VLIDLGGGDPRVWTNTAMDELIVEDGRVVGARVTRDGSVLNVEARNGVLLAAGGFGHNADMRRQYGADQPNEAKWSIANAGDTGEVLQTAMRLGAKTDLLDEAWWLPMAFIADPSAASLGSGRQRHGQALLQRVQLLRRGRQGDVRQQGRTVLAGLRPRVRRSLCGGGQSLCEASRARSADRKGRHQAR
jgi:hypothetical protein